MIVDGWLIGLSSKGDRVKQLPVTSDQLDRVRLITHNKNTICVGWVEATKPNKYGGLRWVSLRSTQPTGIAVNLPDMILPVTRVTPKKGRIKGEDVYVAYSKTASGRYLVVFFIYKYDRSALPISAGDMTSKERRYYERQL